MNREGEAARAHFEFQLKHRHELIMKAMPGELETPATALAGKKKQKQPDMNISLCNPNNIGISFQVILIFLFFKNNNNWDPKP